MPSTLSLFATATDEELAWAAPSPAPAPKPQYVALADIAAPVGHEAPRLSLLRALTGIAAVQEAEPFLAPLDADAVAGYRDVVGEPIDLSTIASLALVGAYDGPGGPAALEDDLVAMCRNGIAYNGGQPLGKAAVRLLSTVIPAVLRQHGLASSGDRPVLCGPGWGPGVPRPQVAVQAVALGLAQRVAAKAPELATARAEWAPSLPDITRRALEGGYASCRDVVREVEGAVVAAMGALGAGPLPSKAPLVDLRASLRAMAAEEMAAVCGVDVETATQALRCGIAVQGAWREAPVRPGRLTEELRGKLLAAVCQLQDMDRGQGEYFTAPFLSRDYVERVAAPVDLQTIRLALVRGTYDAGEAACLVADIDAIADNAVAFNGPLSDVAAAATQLRAHLPKVLATVGL